MFTAGELHQVLHSLMGQQVVVTRFVGNNGESSVLVQGYLSHYRIYLSPGRKGEPSCEITIATPGETVGAYGYDYPLSMLQAVDEEGDILTIVMHTRNETTEFTFTPVDD